MIIPASDTDARVFLVQLNKAMETRDSKAILRAMKDLAGIGYIIQIVTRHVARNGDRLEITSMLDERQMRVNGAKHIPTILKYREILEYLDTHPEEYDTYFIHKNELSPEDYAWICIDPSNRGQFNDDKYG